MASETTTDGGEKLQVLFVDDDRLILEGLRRQFRSKRAEWDMRFAESGGDALDRLGESPADIVVSDMRMPGMTGMELLTAIADRWPETVRFILSGQTDQSDLLNDIGSIHQFLQKPCDEKLLEHAINRARALRGGPDSTLVRGLTASVKSLPIISDTYTKLSELLKTERGDAEAAAAVVSADIGMSAKILQLVNSAFFGMPRSIQNIQEAVVLIGTKNLRQIVLSSNIYDALNDSDAPDHAISSIWKWSTDLGNRAKMLAKNSGRSRDVQEKAYLAGIFSHLGCAIIARKYPDKFLSIVEAGGGPGDDSRAFDHEAYGIHQESISAYALGIWGFSESLVHAVAYQNTPSESAIETLDSPLPWLHLARCLHPALKYTGRRAPDEQWLEQIGISGDEIKTMRSAA